MTRIAVAVGWTRSDNLRISSASVPFPTPFRNAPQHVFAEKSRKY